MAPDTSDTAKLLAGDKEIKVKIPLEFHIKLHTLKVLKGQNISSTVEHALTKYFDMLATKDEGQRIQAIEAMALQDHAH